MPIIIISGTNRADSYTEKVMDIVISALEKKQIDFHQIRLREIEAELSIHPFMYESDQMTPFFDKLQHEIVIPNTKFIYIIPEYNGSVPGILKLYIDLLSSRDYKKCFDMKQALLIGVSDGRTGNTIGLRHFTDILNYMGSVVYPHSIDIPKISKILAEKDTFEALNKRIVKTLDGFMAF